MLLTTEQDDKTKIVKLQLGNVLPKPHKEDRMTLEEIKAEAIKRIWGDGNAKAKKEEADDNAKRLLERLESKKSGSDED